MILGGLLALVRLDPCRKQDLARVAPVTALMSDYVLTREHILTGPAVYENFLVRPKIAWNAGSVPLPRLLIGGLMARESVFNKPDVVLGLDAARGFAPPDQTSPALAAAADALVDTATFTEPDFELFSEPVTELRIHGVSGSDGPTMLEHPQVLQVAGDPVAGFYRRWSPGGLARPSVPWKAEAYSWGGLTEAPLASASWLLLAPFMMYNVAYFMLPPTKPAVAGPKRHLRRDGGHWITHVLLRLLAMAATVQFVAGAATVTMSTVAWQAAGLKHSLLPSWMGWYGRWTAGWRVALAMVAVGAIIAAMWWISVKTASKYEGRVSTSRPALNEKWPLTERGFWKGQVLVGRAAGTACGGGVRIGGADRCPASPWRRRGQVVSDRTGRGCPGRRGRHGHAEPG